MPREYTCLPAVHTPFITALIHENNFHRSGAEGWTSIYFGMNGAKKGNSAARALELERPRPLRSASDVNKATIWAIYGNCRVR